MPLLRRRRRGVTASQFAATKVWLARVALEGMLAEAESRSPLETGGMLLGYVSAAGDHDEMVVQEVLGPGPRSRHVKRRFEPDGDWQQHELARRYEDSGRITTYLGDWHTHPGGVPAPSRRDEKTARSIARTTSARMPRPLMLILASEPQHDGPDDWKLVVYRWSGTALLAVESEITTT
jgi:integrative and conjugative element protein (TIGR02256 family)